MNRFLQKIRFKEKCSKFIDLSKQSYQFLKSKDKNWYMVKSKIVAIAFLLFVNVWLIGEILCIEHSFNFNQNQFAEQLADIYKRLDIITEVQKLLHRQTAAVPNSKATMLPDSLIAAPRNTRYEKQIENEVYRNFRFVSASNIEELRMRNYGASERLPIKIWTHAGKAMLDPFDLKDTIAAVLHRMNNIRSNDNLRALIFETVITEVWMGEIDYNLAARKFKNYGLGQFRLDTARELLAWLKIKRPDVHEQVMSFFDQKKSLKDNLMINVPFSIAMMVQYYQHRIPNIHANIGTLRKRAECWSRIYNSSKGAGSILAYERRVKKFTSTYMKEKPKDKTTKAVAES